MSILHNSEIKEKLVQIKEREYSLDEISDEIDECVTTFYNTFPNDDMNNLTLLGQSTEEPHVFLLGTRKIFFVSENNHWSDVPVMHLSTKNPHSEEYDITLIPNSCESISYELYPFEQCETIPIEYICSDQMTIVEGEEVENGMKYRWTDDIWVHVNMMTDYYYVIQNDKVISGFYDKPTHFQLGDGGTSCFVTDDKNTLIIENSGDVESIVVIKKHKVA